MLGYFCLHFAEDRKSMLYVSLRSCFTDQIGNPAIKAISMRKKKLTITTNRINKPDLNRLRLLLLYIYGFC